MNKIRHIPTGVVIDLNELRAEAQRENKSQTIDIITKEDWSTFYHPDIKIKVERYSIDFGLCALQDFESADNTFSADELKLIMDAIVNSKYFLGSKNDYDNLIAKIDELLRLTYQNR